MPRHLPPAYSPVSFGAIAAATVFGRKASRATLELALCRRFDAEHVTLTGSGTQALQLAITIATEGGHAVALPAYSCFDLVSAVVGAGAPVCFYDVDPRTLTPAFDSLEQCLTQGARAVVAGNLYGFPLPWDELRRIAAPHGAILIEDAAQGLGSSLDGTAAGLAGDLTILSFGRGKGWTGGGGGALLVGGGLRPDAAPLDAAGGRTRPSLVSTAAWLLGRPALYRFPASVPQLGLGQTIYHDPVPPSTISVFSADLATRTEDAAFEVMPERRKCANRWSDAIRAADPSEQNIRLCAPLGALESASCLRLPVRLMNPSSSEDHWKKLRRFGVESGYPRALPELDQVKPLVTNSDERFPGAETLASELVTLPTHHWVRDADIAGALALITGQPSNP